MNRAVFVDRDGVINRMIYHREHGIIDSPFTPSQFELLPGAIRGLNLLWQMDYKLIVVSNQPGIAKGHFTRDTFHQIREKMLDVFHQNQVQLLDDYYCLHHPEAVVPEYHGQCSHRKPEPGMLLQAADEHDLDLSSSWMIGDGVTDIMAGKRAGTHTAFIGTPKCYYCEKFTSQDVYPDMVVSSLEDFALRLRQDESITLPSFAPAMSIAESDIP